MLFRKSKLATLTLVAWVFFPLSGLSDGAHSGKYFQYMLQESGGIFSLDPKLNAYIEMIGRRILESSEEEEKSNFSFYLINNDLPDAWSAPGGRVTITRGMLSILGSEAELAALLSREVQHAKKIYSESLIDGRFLSGTASLARTFNQSENFAVGQARPAINRLSAIKHTRIEELQADLHGQNAMTAAGYHPEAFVILLRSLQEIDYSKGNMKISFPSDERIARVTENVARLSSRNDPDDWVWNIDDFDQQLLTYKKTVESFSYANESRSRRWSSATRLLERAFSTWPENIPVDVSLLSLKSSYLIENRECGNALRILTSEMVAREKSYQDWIDEGLCYQGYGNVEGAIAAYETSNNLLPNSLATKALAELSFLTDDLEKAKIKYWNLMTLGGQYAAHAQMNFVRLDIEDNPERYFITSHSAHTGEFVGYVKNLSEVPVRSLEVEIEASIKGKKFKKKVSSGPVLSSGLTVLRPGWPVSDLLDDAKLSDVSIAIIDVILE